jgi:hypothetical protein
MHVHTDLTFIEGMGRATSCLAYSSPHRPTPLRFVWHHVLPQICGGQTVAANVVSLCDSCHYSVHALLWQLKVTNGGPLSSRRGTAQQRAIAQDGYQRAVAAGTTALIPNEGSAPS